MKALPLPIPEVEPESLDARDLREQQKDDSNKFAKAQTPTKLDETQEETSLPAKHAHVKSIPLVTLIKTCRMKLWICSNL